MQSSDSWKNFTTPTIDQLEKNLETSSQFGLSSNQVVERQKKYKKNILPQRKLQWWHILLQQLRSPFIYLLIIIGLFTFIFESFSSATIILAIVAINTIIGFYQEYNAQRTAELLKKFISFKCTVMRDNNEIAIPTEELVPGDIILLGPGDMIPADVRFIETKNLSVDESVLTGETTPSKKTHEPLSSVADIYQAYNIGFSGTNILTGKARAIVCLTGHHSSLGSLMQITIQSVHESSFSKQIAQFSRFITIVIVTTIIAVVIVQIIIKQGQVEPVMLIAFAITLGVTLIPEALPVVTTFALSQGALKLAKKKVIVKRLSAVEDLGSIQVLCTDKTGTLTENSLHVINHYPEDEDVLLYGLLSSGLTHYSEKNGFEGAIYAELTQEAKKQLEQYKHLEAVPFDPYIRKSFAIVQFNDDYLMLARGAFEDIIKQCIKTNLEIEKLMNWTVEEGKLGHRVLALAKRKLPYYKIDHATDYNDFEFIGMVAFDDPLKKTVPTALAHAQRLNVAIKILSGDAPEVCGAIAKQVGLIESVDKVILGREFEEKNEEEQDEILKNYNVFARVSPSQKYLIIKRLQKQYEVGYLGDGINDVPALRLANVGLAVNNAVDVARDTADIILLRKSLSIIIDGIAQGRTIFANTLKYIKTTLAASFGHFFAVALASLLVTFLPLLPVQLLFLNFITDFPMLAISTDHVSTQDVQRPSRYRFKNLTLFMMVFGLSMCIIDLLIFFIFYKKGLCTLRVNWLVSCILNEIILIYSLRIPGAFYKKPYPSLMLIGLSLSSAIITLLLPFTVVGKNWFKLCSLTFNQIIFLISCTITYLLIADALKRWYNRFYNH